MFPQREGTQRDWVYDLKRSTNSYRITRLSGESNYSVITVFSSSDYSHLAIRMLAGFRTVSPGLKKKKKDSISNISKRPDKWTLLRPEKIDH